MNGCVIGVIIPNRKYLFFISHRLLALVGVVRLIKRLVGQDVAHWDSFNDAHPPAISSDRSLKTQHILSRPTQAENEFRVAVREAPELGTFFSRRAVIRQFQRRKKKPVSESPLDVDALLVRVLGPD